MRYYYFLYSLGFLATLSLILMWRKDLRPKVWPLLLSGATLNPLCEVLFTRDYWRRVDPFSYRGISASDIIFGASVAALSITVYPVLSNKLIKKSGASPKTRLRLLAFLILVPALITIYLNISLGVNSVLALSLAVQPFWIYLLYKRQDLIRPTVVVGAASVVSLTFCYIVALDFIAPHYLADVWYLYGTRLGVTIFGNTPVTELIWFWAIPTYAHICYMSITGQFYGKLSQKKT